jgi:hypothetical protein
MSEGKVSVVACEVLRKELETVIGDRDIPLYFLDQGLHRTPKLMPDRIAEAINKAQAGGAGRLALGYGLCSNGLVGVEANRPMVVPKCHDCIAMIVGSPAKYRQLFARQPGTYYLSAGWLEVAKDPLSIMELEYVESVGREDAEWVMTTELTHYTHICYLRNGLGSDINNKKRVLENCRAFGKEYMEIDCSLDYFQKLIDGPYPQADFINLDGGRKVVESMFRGA